MRARNSTPSCDNSHLKKDESQVFLMASQLSNTLEANSPFPGKFDIYSSPSQFLFCKSCSNKLLSKPERGFICFKTYCRMALHLTCGRRGKRQTMLKHRSPPQSLGVRAKCQVVGRGCGRCGSEPWRAQLSFSHPRSTCTDPTTSGSCWSAVYFT